MAHQGATTLRFGRGLRPVGEVPMVAGPGDEMAVGAAGRGRMRASYADRERVIDTLKTAFVHGRLTRDELDTRAGQALSARTYADLAAVAADIPPAPAAARPARPPAPARRRPLARAAAKSGICLIIMATAVGAAIILPADQGGSSPWIGLMVLLAVSGLWTALGIMGYAVFTAWDERSSRRQLPPWPGPGGHALEAERSSGTGHGAALPPDRPDQTRVDLRSDRSRPGWPHSPGRGARKLHGVRPVPDAV
jgi:hypothetical protein